MAGAEQIAPSIIVIFGAGGDLTWRKLAPALFALARGGKMPERYAIIGVGRERLSDESWRDQLKRGMAKGGHGKPASQDWRKFAGQMSYLRGDCLDAKLYQALSKRIAELEQGWDAGAQRIFYLATPPVLFPEVPPRLAEAGLVEDSSRSRLVIEKPFGYDLESARELNGALAGHFEERQLFRIDHYLGKETVQNILAFRFANPMFEPIWDRRHVDYVTITVAEDVGVGHRAGYFEHAGDLRDMVQNHLMQLLCLVAMEPVVSFEADDVRNKKLDVLRAVRPISHEAVHDCAVRGQYGEGWIRGRKIQGYRQENGVAADSQTETFAALKLMVDNWRWTGVPFYLRTGKRLARQASEISIHFRSVPHQVFPQEASVGWQPCRLVMMIQPDEGIILRFQAKQPGLAMLLRGVNMQFSYAREFSNKAPPAYETLLMDVLKNDPTLFMRFDQVEAAWRIVRPIQEVWAAAGPADFPNYPAGSWGPAAAAALAAKQGHSWPVPSSLEPSSGKSGETHG